jgi:hypothetical protein
LKNIDSFWPFGGLLQAVEKLDALTLRVDRSGKDCSARYRERRFNSLRCDSSKTFGFLRNRVDQGSVEKARLAFSNTLLELFSITGLIRHKMGLTGRKTGLII